jgi:Tol biopolymer transport system component/DNA-binding winged helix-turn-helix (wHTH) protein
MTAGNSEGMGVRPTIHTVGPWEIDPIARVVTGPAGIRRLEPKPLALLLLLAANPGRVVSRQQLLAAAWGDEMATDDVLSRAVSELRRALGDDPGTPVYVETIRGAGYRLVVPSVLSAAMIPADKAGSPAEAPTATVTTPLLTGGSLPKARAWSVAAFAVLLIVAVWLTRADRTTTVSPADPHLVPLTSDSGEAGGPRVSPDGTRIAYVWNNATESASHLIVQAFDGGNRVEVATGAARALAWSPDGSKLVFVGSDNAGRFVGVMTSLGGTTRILSRVAQPPVLGVDWSPDGREIAVATHDEPFATFRIHLVSVDSASIRPITSGGNAAVGDAYPSFAPDGRYLAFARFATETSSDVFLIDLVSGAETRLTSDDRNISALSFAPDGHSIVYASNRDGGSALWRVSLLGGAPTRLISSDHGITGLSYSHGRQELVVSAGDQTQQLWAVPTTPGAPAEPLTKSTRADGLPSVSPGGDRIAFISDRSGSREVWTTSARGDSAVRLTDAGSFASAPGWAPNRRDLVVQRQAATQTELWIIDTDRRAARRLHTTLSDPIAPNWSRDGRSVISAAKENGSWQLWRIPIDGTAPTRLTEHGGISGVETADGTSLLFTKPSAPGLWSLDLTTKAERVLASSVLTGDWTNWTLGRRNVYYIDRDASGSQRIVEFSLATHMTRTILGPVRTPMGTGGLSVSADERRLVFAQSQRGSATLYRATIP